MFSRKKHNLTDTEDIIWNITLGIITMGLCGIGWGIAMFIYLPGHPNTGSAPDSTYANLAQLALTIGGACIIAGFTARFRILLNR